MILGRIPDRRVETLHGRELRLRKSQISNPPSGRSSPVAYEADFRHTSSSK